MEFGFDETRNLRLHFQASPAPAAQNALRDYTERYGQTENPADADCLVALGGDGQTLRTLREGILHKKPVIGINFGHAGFLQNPHDDRQDLIERIRKAEAVELSPLRIEAEFTSGDIRTDFAINEVHICNHNRAEGIYLKVAIDGKPRIDRLGADGLIISTTVGSTGYNKSARGPILPLGDDMIAFTPNNAFMPDRMRATVIRPFPVDVNVIDHDFRPADVYVDNHLVGESVRRIRVTLDKSSAYRLLFDPGTGLEEKVMRTQFPAPAPSG